VQNRFIGIHATLSFHENKIGGTKVLQGVYNQQFKGTFKNPSFICITPSQGNQTVLKFDQPLYNEYPNTSNNNYQKI
jgi:hypothetical protein